MSNTFMDALMDPGHKKTLSKPAKKRTLPNVKPAVSLSVMPSVMVIFLAAYFKIQVSI